MKKLLLLGLLLAPTMALASLWDHYGTNLPTIAERGILAQQYGIVEQSKDYTGTYEQNIALEKALTIKMADLYQGQYLGASVLPIAGTTYNLAGSGLSSTATSIILQSLTIPQTGQKIQDSDLSDIFYITLEPGNRTRQEIASCTTVVQNSGGTATLSGCSRGLSPITPYTASSTLAFTHAGGSQVIFSDPPQLFNQFTAKDNEETINRIWTYSVYPESSVGTNATTTNQFITLGQANSIGNQGAATSTATNAGISEEATQLEMASSTPFDANNPHHISSEYASSSPSIRGLGYVPVTENDGYLDNDWIRKSDNFTWTGQHTFSATSTMATTTIADLVINNQLKTQNIIVGLTASTTFTGATLPQPMYIASSTSPNAGKALISDGNDVDTLTFFGFAVSNATVGQTVYVQISGVVNGFTGLTPGALYYVSDTVGVLSTSKGTYPITVGRAISTTQILLTREKSFGTKIAMTSGTTYTAYADGICYGYADNGAFATSYQILLNGDTATIDSGSGTNGSKGASVYFGKSDTFAFTSAATTKNFYYRYHN